MQFPHFSHFSQDRAGQTGRTGRTGFTSRRRVLAGLAATPAAIALGTAQAGPASADTGSDSSGFNSRQLRRRGPAARPPHGNGLEVVSAEPHRGLTEAFTRYGNSGDGWTGADSTYSRPLPGGRHLWMFSDTFLGTVNADGSRPADSPIINNSFIVQRRSEMRTVHGGTEDKPEAVLQAPKDQWYWLGGSYLGAGALNIMFIRFERTGPGMWDWVWRDNRLGRVDPYTLRLRSTHAMPSSAEVQWSAWLQPFGAHTYVYGCEDRGDSKYMHVARVPGEDLRRPWQYWTGSGWSPRETDSARVMAGVANEYSVSRWNGRYLLVTHNTNELFSKQILAYVGDRPTGPFTQPTLVYETPETGEFGSYGDKNIITYNAHEHPDLRRDDRLIVTYNVNSLDFAGLLDDVTKYRPRFIEVRL